jgi:hypothetical protein
VGASLLDCKSWNLVWPRGTAANLNSGEGQMSWEGKESGQRDGRWKGKGKVEGWEW